MERFPIRDLDRFAIVSMPCFHCGGEEGVRLIMGHAVHVACYQKKAQEGIGLDGASLTGGIAAKHGEVRLRRYGK